MAAGPSILRSLPAAFAYALVPAVARAESVVPVNGWTALIALLIGLVLGAAAFHFVTHGRGRRIEKLEEQLLDAEKARDEAAAEDQRKTDELGLLRDKLASLGRERDSYRRLINAAPFAVWRRNTAGEMIWHNTRLDEILGPDAPTDEIASRTDPDRPQLLVARAREETTLAGEERRFVVDGQRHIFRVLESPLLGDDESAGFAIDVSEIDELRRESRRQAQANNAVLERIGTAVAIYDRNKRLIFANRAFKTLWGVDDAFVAGKPTLGEMMDRLHESRMLPEQLEYRQFRAAREALFSTLIEPIEELYQRPDERMMRVTISRHGFGGLLFLFEDATDRMVMERNLNTYIAVQRATLDNLYEAVAVFGPDGRLNLTNAGYRQMWNLPVEFTDTEPHVREVVDRILSLLGMPEDLRVRRDAIIASATEMRQGTGRLELPDGRIIDFTATALPDARTLFTYLDVTDSLRIERALRERNEALVAADLIKSEFLENMSYELRTPLNTILGFTEILHNDYFGPLNDRQREYSAGILEASEQFLSMINDMLDLASIQAGHLQVDLVLFDVAEAFDRALEQYRERASRRQIALKTELPADLPKLRGDPRRVEQVLSNLLSNAVKFTPPGGEVRVGAASTGSGMEVWVADNGIGIPDDEQAHVFETFKTSDRHTRRGAGLGLALVRNLMELLGGSVTLTSKTGVGTTVVCHFPNDAAEADAALPGVAAELPEVRRL